MWRRRLQSPGSRQAFARAARASQVATAAEGRDRRQHPVLLDHSHRGHRDKPPPNPALSHHPQTQTRLPPNQLRSSASDSYPQHLPPTFLRPQIRRPGPVTKWLTLQTLNPQSQFDSYRCTLRPTCPDTPQLVPKVSVPSWPADHSPPGFSRKQHHIPCQDQPLT